MLDRWGGFAAPLDIKQEYGLSHWFAGRTRNIYVANRLFGKPSRRPQTLQVTTKDLVDSMKNDTRYRPPKR